MTDAAVKSIATSATDEQADSLRVQEIFGPTIQGEGALSGRSAWFVRLYGCTVGCPWCDQAYGPDDNYGQNLSSQLMTISSIVERVSSAGYVCISGGEPMMQNDLPKLCRALVERGKFVSIETSGAYYQDLPPGVWVTLSPKDHLKTHPILDDRVLRRANEIKLVVEQASDLEYYKSRGLLPAISQPTQVYLQPEWNSIETSLPTVIDLLHQNSRYKLSLQTHKYIGVQ